MSTALSSLALCRCGRTTSLSDQSSRRVLDCGHFICNDCWSYGQDEPAPWCDRCNVALYRNELHRRVDQYQTLERLHIQKMKLAADNITKLKSYLPLNKQKNRDVPQVGSPNMFVHQLPQVQAPPSSSAGPSTVTGIDWNSEQGKIFKQILEQYFYQGQDLLNASHNENAKLKSRVAELASQLEAKSQPNNEAITVIEKAELMEAELEGLHERLDKCEEDLEKAQSELAMAKTNNEQMTRDIAKHKSVEASAGETMKKYYTQFTELHAKLLKTEHELSEAKKTLDVRNAIIQSFADSKANEEHASESILKITNEKVAAERELARLTELADAKEQENDHLRSKLVKSAELASELSRLHLAANTRSEVSEARLILAQEELQSLKQHSTVQQPENNDVLNIADIERYKSQITALEAKLAEATRTRENAVVQAKSWERNRDSWKRWGQLMALRAQQAEEEAQKAKAALAGEIDLGSGLQEPPPLTPFAMTPEPSTTEELGKTRKRPLDVPDTDVDGLHAIAQTSSDPAQTTGADLDEGSDRKKVRLAQAS